MEGPVAGRRPVGPVDNIWLRMDRPNNLMVIDSVMWLDEPLDIERFRAVLHSRIVDRFPVFHQRIAPDTPSWLPPQWEDDPDFDLDDHLTVVSLPAGAGEPELAAYVESLMHVPLDRDHALWEVHVVEGYGGGAAVVCRFHHAIADGIALAQVLLSLTDEDPNGDLVEHPVDPVRNSGWTLSVPGLGAARSIVSTATKFARPSLVQDAATLASQTLHIADKLLLSSNPPGPLLGEPGLLKRAVWSRPHPLSQIKAIGRSAGATVNDVLVAAVAGALSEYVVDEGGTPEDLTTMVPVNLRPVDEPLPRELGNKFALAMLPMPTGARSPRARLDASKQRMDSIKASPEAYITFGLINAIGLTHPRLEDVLVDFFSGKAIGVTTNVMGPVQGRYVAGSRIAGVLGWVPGSGRQTVGVCIFSYDSTVRVGFKVDATVVPQAERLVDAFDAELDDLLRISTSARP
jgi:WS/DGAT/MGAT family acyltransferase